MMNHGTLIQARIIVPQMNKNYMDMQLWRSMRAEEKTIGEAMNVIIWKFWKK